MLKERDLPERWSAKRKSEIVVRLLRGEDLGELSREIQVLPGSWFSSLPPGPPSAGRRYNGEASGAEGLAEADT